MPDCRAVLDSCPKGRTVLWAGRIQEEVGKRKGGVGQGRNRRVSCGQVSWLWPPFRLPCVPCSHSLCPIPEAVKQNALSRNGHFMELSTISRADELTILL